ncbi:MAG: sensor histidine kinase [Acidimicrobiales bacterium]
MASRPTPAEHATVLRRATHPPVGEARFWVVQAMVLLIAGIHLLVDLHSSVESGAFPSGLPVALLVIPVGYAALRYGLAGSAATGIWATLLWLPDLLLPHDHGHVGGDIVDLALVDVVAFLFGQRIEAERVAHARVESTTAAALAVETRYRQLFQTNSAPILVLDTTGTITDANPAATVLLGSDLVGRPGASALAREVALDEQAGQVVSMPDGRDYRIDLVSLHDTLGDGSVQVIFEDVTEERSEGRRATRYAALVVQAEEAQRRRLARELHDEPLQLFLHLGRRLERLGRDPGVTEDVARELAEARRQALDAATRLRNLARDLRPPALDELGFLAALSSLVADVEEESELLTDIEVRGVEVRLSAELELGAFRIVEEAVRNTVRHSGAHELRVTVAFESQALSVTVADDGRGFATEKVAELGSGHFGLLGMGERSRLLGGHLEVRSEPGEGAVIVATLPIVMSKRGPGDITA